MSRLTCSLGIVALLALLATPVPARAQGEIAYPGKCNCTHCVYPTTICDDGSGIIECGQWPGFPYCGPWALPPEGDDLAAFSADLVPAVPSCPDEDSFVRGE